MSIRNKNLNLYFEQLEKILPGIDFSSVSSMYNGAEPTSGNIILSSISNAFKKLLSLNSKINIIHYTSIETMLGVLSTQSFRLYNCLNLNDPKEIEFANKKFSIGLTVEEIHNFKQNYFVGSFCEYDIELKNDDFNLWRLYGNYGNGAGLVFEIENIEDNWENVFLGKVLYNEKSHIIKSFEEFIRFHNQFNNENGLFENTPHILPIIGLHFKDEIWQIENEFRLFTACPFDQYTFDREYRGNQNSYLSNSLEHTINRNGNLVSYISLPIDKKRALQDLENRFGSENLAKEHFSSIPHLRLKKVILGYNVPLDLFNNVGRLFDFYRDIKKIEVPVLEYSSLWESFKID